jgi:hypothetical protein
VKGNRLVWASSTIALTLVLSASAFAQTQPVQTRIPQQVIINGQKVNGAYVATASGGMQAYTCSNPQPYVTPDNASQGWACYDQAAGVWLLNAVPPSTQAAQPAPAPAPAPQAPAPMGAPLPGQPPAVVYQQPPTVIYQQPYPAVVYAAPAPVIVAPAYPPGVVLGAAAINATGRIVSAAFLGPRFGGFYYYGRGFRRW